MIAEDTDISFLEEILETPHCETQHERPYVHIWAGDCTHEVVATLSYCNGEGGICANTVKGILGLNKNIICHDCKKRVTQCWRVIPIGR